MDDTIYFGQCCCGNRSLESVHQIRREIKMRSSHWAAQSASLSQPSMTKKSNRTSGQSTILLSDHTMPSPLTTTHAGATIAAAKTSPLQKTRRRCSTGLTLPSRMATAAMQASAAALRPFSSRSRFLTGGSPRKLPPQRVLYSPPNARHLPPSRWKPSSQEG
ncbi:hypothetical protein ZIOFF_045269 [Zingiber officinale]|uniref:Uncharacterized protein n=1 Tax=Zingiber officinale TaxID=94328 RepID=A0A8J5FYR8_ZINOF|nr:hypothetical protein ZIOFF_045269 [Zingiber officinale]